MCKRKYPLKWLDMLIQKYDPTKEPSYNDQTIDDVLSKTEQECTIIRERIQEQVFQAAADNKKGKQLVRYYHTALTHYMNDIYERFLFIDCSCQPTHQLYHALLEQLDDLLNFLDTNFNSYLGNDLRVGGFYLHRVKRNMEDTINSLRIRQATVKSQHSKIVCDIVLNAMERFVMTAKHHYKVTYRCVQYRLELLRKMEILSNWESDDKLKNFPLDRLLIYMNFNSKTYIDYLTACFSEIINEREVSQQMDCLLICHKEFKQLHCKTDHTFNPEYQNIDLLLDNWFNHEIAYRKQIQQIIPINQTVQKQAAPAKISSNSKVLLGLSSDQIALFLRAADEMRILSARSMTEVFRSIVPHLSTPHKKELSYEAVRIKSYNPEDQDKEIIVGALYKMIDKIKQY